jgi:hypothetical protein
MSSAHSKYVGLLPVEQSDELVRPADLKNYQSPKRPSSLGERALRSLALFLIMFCVCLSAILAWRSNGNMARQMAADLYQKFGWLAPQQAPAAQKVPETTAVIASTGHSSREIEEILGADHSTIARDRIAAGQEQMTRSSDQTATNITQAASAQARGIAAEVRVDEASLQLRSPQAPSERGKQLSAAGGHDSSCFPSASAVLEHHRGGWPSWTLKAPGHEGTVCWFASARPRTADHRREKMPRTEIVGTRENALPAPPAGWVGGLP